MNTLKGKNIFLRALESEDINYLFSIENNEKYWSISDSQIPFSRYLLNRYLKINLFIEILIFKKG